jgi:hypothetical protein
MAPRIQFQTEPSRYRHSKLKVEGDSAELEWLPFKGGCDFIASLMQPCWERQFAPSAPNAGIDNKPGDFEFVRIHQGWASRRHSS